MQYILSEEEYQNLVPRYKYEEEREKVEKLNQKVLELTCQGKCRKERGGYCDFCFITETCTKTKSYSK